MFKIPTTEIEMLGEKIQVKPMAASKMLEFRAKYQKIDESDISGIIDLMEQMIIQCSESPKMTKADLADLDFMNLKQLFVKVSEACGLSAEKNESGTATI